MPQTNMADSPLIGAIPVSGMLAQPQMPSAMNTSSAYRRGDQIRSDRCQRGRYAEWKSQVLYPFRARCVG